MPVTFCRAWQNLLFSVFCIHSFPKFLMVHSFDCCSLVCSICCSFISQQTSTILCHFNFCFSALKLPLWVTSQALAHHKVPAGEFSCHTCGQPGDYGRLSKIRWKCLWNWGQEPPSFLLAVNWLCVFSKNVSYGMLLFTESGSEINSFWHWNL